MRIRQPAVAGKFYPNTKEEIEIQLSQILRKESPFINKELFAHEIIGAVVPHAGYMFSAYQALHFFEILRNSEQQFDTFVIINPNHTGYGDEISLDENDFWETPMGNVEIDRKFYDLLNFSENSQAHKYEHSGEVMIPLLQHCLNYNFKILPICMSNQNPANAELIAEELIKANEVLKKKLCIIASSDFSHFVDPKEGQQLDQYILKEALNLNSAGVYREVKDKNISVCGFGPIMTLIEYAKRISNNPKSEILKIGHSGEVIPSDEVVDYVSMLFYE